MWQHVVSSENLLQKIRSEKRGKYSKFTVFAMNSEYYFVNK